MSAHTTLEPAGHGGRPPGSGGTRSTHLTWEVRDGRAVVVKRATGRDRPALRREAAVLRSLGGSGVVRIVDLGEVADRTEMVTAAVEGPTLASFVGDSTTEPADGARALADMCEAVARFHARGWAHGNLRADHVLVSRRGRIRFCSLASAMPLDLANDGGRDDRAAALRMVDEWTDALGRAGGPPWRRLRRTRLVRHVRRRTMRLVDDPDPVVLARVLRRSVRRRRRSAGVAVGAVVLLLLVGAWMQPSNSWPEPPRHPVDRLAPARGRPDVDITVDGNDVAVGGVHYRIGSPGDVVAVADWDCDGRQTALVLRPRTGEVLEFTDWARPGAPTTARPVAAVPGARSIDAPRDRCGPARVVLQDGSRQTFGGKP